MNQLALIKEKEDSAMKKLLLISLFLLLFVRPVHALITIDNLDFDRFPWQSSYRFASSDLAASLTEAEMPTEASQTNQNLYYTISRGSVAGYGKIIGISVAGNGAIVAGGATFDVTINGCTTGIQAVIDSPVRAALVDSGSTGTTYAYMRQSWNTDVTSRGFKAAYNKGSYHDVDHYYGKATALSAGDRIGIKVSTSSGFLPAGSRDYVATVYVLE